MTSIADLFTRPVCFLSYLGIGDWAQQIPQNLSVSLDIEVSAVEVEATSDVACNIGIYQCVGVSCSSSTIKAVPEARRSGSLRDFGSTNPPKCSRRNENSDDEEEPGRSKKAKVQGLSGSE